MSEQGPDKRIEAEFERWWKHNWTQEDRTGGLLHDFAATVWMQAVLEERIRIANALGAIRADPLQSEEARQTAYKIMQWVSGKKEP